MTKDSQFVRAVYLGRDLPPLGTQTEYGKIMSYNSNGTIRVGGTVLVTETGLPKLVTFSYCPTPPGRAE